MIYGIGTDIASISRISGNIERYGRRFLAKFCTPSEIDAGMSKSEAAEYFAARFAAKEAFFKALGTGWGRGVSMKELSIEKDENGRPFFNLTLQVEEMLDSMGIKDVHLSITHEAGIAQAFVVMEGVEDEKST